MTGAAASRLPHDAICEDANKDAVRDANTVINQRDSIILNKTSQIWTSQVSKTCEV